MDFEECYFENVIWTLQELLLYIEAYRKNIKYSGCSKDDWEIQNLQRSLLSKHCFWKRRRQAIFCYCIRDKEIKKEKNYVLFNMIVSFFLFACLSLDGWTEEDQLLARASLIQIYVCVEQTAGVFITWMYMSTSYIIGQAFLKIFCTLFDMKHKHACTQTGTRCVTEYDSEAHRMQKPKLEGTVEPFMFTLYVLLLLCWSFILA